MAVAEYVLRLYDQDGLKTAVFDDWLTLKFSRKVNDIGSYTLTFRDNGDARLEYFTLDSQLVVKRRIPGFLPWTEEFHAFHRTPNRYIDANGVANFDSKGVCYNELLSRRIVGYKEGTIRADKNDASETVMKEYVTENCTGTADLTWVGRLNYDAENDVLLYQAGFPGFSVQTDTMAGALWTGSRPYENLLEVLKDIAEFSAIDFVTVDNGVAKFQFMTYPNQMGTDRTEGNGSVPPVTFLHGMGNIKELQYVYDRLSEANAVVVLGKGDASTRTTMTRHKPSTQDNSPWNVREISRSASNYDEDYETYSLQTSGDEILEEMKGKLNFKFQPLQQESALYGVDYFLGDRVTVKYGSLTVNRKIVGVNIDVTEGQGEQLSLDLSGIPGT